MTETERTVLMVAPHSDQDDGIVELVKDHHEVKEAFQRLEGGSGAERRDVLPRVISELARHSAAEEQHLYPLVRKVLANGNDLADQELRQHTQMETSLKGLEEMDSSDPRFEARLLQTITETLYHINEEETQLFPRLRAACSEDELRDLGDKIRRTKKRETTDTPR